MKKKLYIILLFQTLIISAFGITVTTTAPNTGVSKVMTVDNGKVYELNFNTDVLSSSVVEVNIKELGLTIASQQIATNGNHALTFTPTSNAITIEFNRINSGTASLQFEVDNIQLKEVISSKLTHKVGVKNYELSDHLGNVRTTVSDKKVSGLSKVISANDYYPFGMEARSVSNGEYRYGFNTQEKENEIAQGIYTAEYWKYDSRVARRWNLDPKGVIGISEYACFANNPIYITDHYGDTIKIADLLKSDRQTGEDLISDLEDKTGLLLCEKDGYLEVLKDKNGDPMHFKGMKNLKGEKTSKTARKSLLEAIESSEMVEVVDNRGDGNYVPGGGSNTINYDIEEIKLIQNNLSPDLNKGTMGPAIVFLHELGHTIQGGGHLDEPSRVDHDSPWYYEPGTNSERVNKMRKELGSGYGIRAAYNLFGRGVSGDQYMPFSKKSLRQIKKGQVPSEMFLRL